MPYVFIFFPRVQPSDSIYTGYQGSTDMTPEVYCSCDVNGVSNCVQFGDVAACGVSTTGLFNQV